MHIETHYLAHRSVRKRHHMAFIIFSILIILATAVDLALHPWFRYCWWDFGLVYANSFTTYTILNNESTISDVNSDICESLKEFIDDICPEFCSYINSFQISGAFMIIFGTLSLIFNFVAILFHLWSFFKVQFKFQKISVFLVLPSCFYICGLIIFNCVLNFLNIKQPKTNNYQTSSKEMKFGYTLSFIIAPFTVLLAIYGLAKTRIAFTGLNS